MEIIKKLSEREKNLLFILLIFIILFCSYQFGYVKLTGKIDTLSSENLELSVKLNDLKQKDVAKEKYIEETDKMLADTQDMFNHLATSMTQDKNTIFVTKLEKEADMIVSAISFGDITHIYDSNRVMDYTTDQTANDTSNGSDTTDVTAEGKGLKGYQSSITINYQTNYGGLKKAIDFINNYHEKMRIQSITAAFDSTTGNLTGTITIDLFMVSGEGQEAELFDIYGIDLGTDNIFGTFELPVE
ncbi:MAG: hypothetical protein E6600_15880 [Anaerocolumna aminovalerica]|uniref:hypothetical protein n=1 Tax=Anaerocolumna aminovalerica TaxID=1527 RepID=UPI002915659A|nr:hypothetical protein [Anaerocolumna aminovalerica]MDU6265975.1 hypothetical protein [Anaerocolumna aminovalerica]